MTNAFIHALEGAVPGCYNLVDDGALMQRFGYVPRKTSAQVLDAFIAARECQGHPLTRREAA